MAAKNAHTEIIEVIIINIINIMAIIIGQEGDTLKEEVGIAIITTMKAMKMKRIKTVIITLTEIMEEIAEKGEETLIIILIKVETLKEMMIPIAMIIIIIITTEGKVQIAIIIIPEILAMQVIVILSIIGEIIVILISIQDIVNPIEKMMMEMMNKMLIKIVIFLKKFFFNMI